MSREIIDYMVDIVRTMSDEDILDFIKEYNDELSVGITSSLITEVNDSELLSNYVKYVSENIETILCKWDVSFSCYADLDDRSLMYDYYCDVYGATEDEFLIKEEEAAKTNAVNGLITDLMNAIGKVDSDNEKVKLLNLFFMNIKPYIISYVGQEIFDRDCRDSFEAELLMVLKKLHDLDILELLKDNDKGLNEKEILLLFSNIESDVLRGNFIDNFDFISGSMYDNQVNNQDDFKDIILKDIQQISDIYSSHGGISHSQELVNYVSVLVMDIVDACYNIDDDDFLENVFKEIFEMCGAMFPLIVAAICDDDKKIKLFHEYDIAGIDGYVEVLSSIKDNNKFRELYDNLDDGFVDGFGSFEDSDRLEIICSRRDKALAYKMLRDKYNKFRANSLEDNRAIDVKLINQVCNLISIFDDKEQVEIYGLFAENALLFEKAMLILPLSDNGIKREFLNDMKKLDIEENSRYVMSKKLYN